jgi:hypothetical protein
VKLKPRDEHRLQVSLDELGPGLPGDRGPLVLVAERHQVGRLPIALAPLRRGGVDVLADRVQVDLAGVEQRFQAVAVRAVAKHTGHLGRHDRRCDSRREGAALGVGHHRLELRSGVVAANAVVDQ